MLLEIAAAKAVLTKLRTEPVIETLKTRGQTILDGVGGIISDAGVDRIIAISGHPSWSFLHFRDAAGFSRWQIKTFFLQEVFRRGIYTLGTHNLSYAHTDQDVEALLACYRQVFPLIGEAVDDGSLDDRLECQPLVPLFTPR